MNEEQDKEWAWQCEEQEEIFDVHLQNAIDDLWFFAKYALVLE